MTFKPHGRQIFKLMQKLWLRLDSLSTRKKLFLLLLGIILPFTVITVIESWLEYQQNERQVEDLMLAQAKLLASTENQMVVQSENLLQSLANHPIVQHRDWSACKPMLHVLWSHFNDIYANIHVADLSGNILCSGVPSRHDVSISHREDFQDALRQNRFVVGDLVVSLLTGRHSVNLRQPIMDADGKPFAILSAQVDHTHFQLRSNDIVVDKGGVLLLMDRHQHLIVRYPYREGFVRGSKLQNVPLRQAMEQHTEGIVRSSAAPDGIERIFGFATTGSEPNSGIYVAVGYPVELLYGEARKELLIEVIGICLVAACIFCTGWFGIGALALQKIDRMIATSISHQKGDLHVRTGIRHEGDELNQLAQALDQAAEDQERLMLTLREQSIRDGLTGLFNRRYLDERLPIELAREQREQKTLGVIALDIDHFKRFNDTWGHSFGDQVLKAIATTLISSVRGFDIVCRSGGEEFTIVMPGTDLNTAADRAERIRLSVSQLQITPPDEGPVQVTISLGVAIYPLHGELADTLIRHADEALYMSKAEGRNRTTVYTA